MADRQVADTIKSWVLRWLITRRTLLTQPSNGPKNIWPTVLCRNERSGSDQTGAGHVRNIRPDPSADG